MISFKGSTIIIAYLCISSYIILIQADNADYQLDDNLQDYNDDGSIELPPQQEESEQESNDNQRVLKKISLPKLSFKSTQKKNKQQKQTSKKNNSQNQKNKKTKNEPSEQRNQPQYKRGKSTKRNSNSISQKQKTKNLLQKSLNSLIHSEVGKELRGALNENVIIKGSQVIKNFINKDKIQNNQSFQQASNADVQFGKGNEQQIADEDLQNQDVNGEGISEENEVDEGVNQEENEVDEGVNQVENQEYEDQY